MKPRLKEERGQAAIFMALFVSTMIMLFAFTTNIGMLVHAKINLQNAADAAAYAGAAVQARQLTNAAYLNWEMRRALKEFLFYYTVRGQMSSMPCYPLDGTGIKYPLCAQTPGEERYGFQFDDPREASYETGGPYIPTVCVIFSPDNNYCQKDRVAGIPEFPSGGGWGVADPIVAAVRNATSQIIQKKKDDCEGRTVVNQQFLSMWLFNIYPYNDTSNQSTLYIGNDHDNPFPFNGLERLGILPRMAMLRARIDNIEEALNMNMDTEGFGATIDGNTMGALRGAGKPLDYFERPIQAYLSARNNLPSVTEDNGNFSSVQLTELLPNRPAGVEKSFGLKNEPVLVKFNDILAKASFTNSLFKEVGDPDLHLAAGNCVQFRELRTISNFPFGITKDPTVLTYYAVRLEAQARLLFSPFGDGGTVTLSAYSAAKPFGSRVGRNLNPEGSYEGALQMMEARGNLGRLFNGTGLGGITTEQVLDLASPMFPNVLVTDENNSKSSDNGFTTNAHLGYLRGAVATDFGHGQRLDLGVRLAGAYAPWEVGFYTPPANYQKDVIGKFEDNPIYGGKFFSLLAPVYPVNGGGDRDLTFLRMKVNRYLEADQVDAQTLDAFKDFLETVVMTDANFGILQGYMTETKEDAFDFIPDPLLSDEPELQGYARSWNGRWTVAGMQEPYKRQLTSWNNQKTAVDADLGIEQESELGLDIGRSGYSVRFVSFDTLKKGGQATNDPAQAALQWTNPLDRLDAGGAAARIFNDINKLKH